MHIGIDIGGTNIKALAITREGNELARRSMSTGDGAEPAYKSAVPELVADLERAFGPAVSVGISSPGLAARDARSIQWMMGRMAGVMGLDWTAHLKRASQVFVLNDAHAALLGEAWLGAAKDKSDVVMLTLGTGVGGAIIAGGKLLKGHLGRAGHIGHISLDPAGVLDIVNTPGSLEDAFGDCTIASRSDRRYGSTRDLVTALSTDPLAKKIWDDSVRALAAGMVSIANVVDPKLFVLGGGIMAAGGCVAHASATTTRPLRVAADGCQTRPRPRHARRLRRRIGRGPQRNPRRHSLTPHTFNRNSHDTFARFSAQKSHPDRHR